MVIISSYVARLIQIAAFLALFFFVAAFLALLLLCCRAAMTEMQYANGEFSETRRDSSASLPSQDVELAL